LREEKRMISERPWKVKLYPPNVETAEIIDNIGNTVGIICNKNTADYYKSLGIRRKILYAK
jgi:hypothetical protein